MIGDLERRLVELRFLEGIEKVEHVPYRSGDEFWVRFNKPLDLTKLREVVKRHGFGMVRFASVPSKLPGKLAEVLWNGVSFVIARNVSGLLRFKSMLGFEPDGIAKIAKDLHGPYQIFMTTDEEGLQILYDYLGVKYVAPPPPPPKPTAPAKTPTPVTPRQVQTPVTQQQAPRPPLPAVTRPEPGPQETKPVQQPPRPAVPAPVKTSDASQAQENKDTDKRTQTSQS